MSRETDAVDRALQQSAKQEAKNARQAQRQQTFRDMEETIAIIGIAFAVVLVCTVVMTVVYLLNKGPSDQVITRQKNFQTCVEKGGTFIPTGDNKYACIFPPAPQETP